jgi:hypothetical protein
LFELEFQSAQLALGGHQAAHGFVAQGSNHTAESCTALRPILADDGAPALVLRLDRSQRLRKQHARDVTGSSAWELN